jgi:tetratricopeptide (TPR) repeat protein
MQKFSSRQLRQCLTEALEFARTSNSEAIARLERGLEDARRAQDAGAISLLAKNAGLIHMESNALDSAAICFEEALQNEPSDGYLYLALIDVYQRLGYEDKARRAITGCREIAKTCEDPDFISILQKRGILSEGNPES